MAEPADIKKGPIFRAIDRWDAAEDKALTSQSINLIVKRVAPCRDWSWRRFRRRDCAPDI